MLTPDLSVAEAMDTAANVEEPAVDNGTPTEPPNETGEGEPSTPENTGETDNTGNDQAANKILSELGVESLDDVKAVIESNRALQESLGERDLKDVLAKAEKLAELEKGWAEDDEKNLRAEESPEETIARLDAKLTEVEGQHTSELATQVEAQAAQKVVEQYDTVIEDTVKAADLNDSQREFLTSVLKSDNPTNSIDIASKVDVTKMTSSMVDALKSFTDQVVKDYVDGKTKVPVVPPGGNSAPDASGSKAKTISGATKSAIARLLGR